MQFRFHTKALLYNAEGKILILQRSDTWKRDLPWWKTELPERIENAIIREIQEETGMQTIQNLHVLHLRSGYRYTPETDEYFVLIIYQGQVNDNPTISDEHLNYQRITPKELFSIWLSDYLQKDLENIRNLIDT
jgi:8-oxo-dGTP pyrophosphatase MutT (NUDIX family)